MCQDLEAIGPIAVLVYDQQKLLWTIPISRSDERATSILEWHAARQWLLGLDDGALAEYLYSVGPPLQRIKTFSTLSAERIPSQASTAVRG